MHIVGTNTARTIYRTLQTDNNWFLPFPLHKIGGEPARAYVIDKCNR